MIEEVLASRSHGNRNQVVMKVEDMPMHDWRKVEAGIFHAFHHRWISELSDFLNGGALPSDYYALPEQVAAGFGPDVQLPDMPLYLEPDVYILLPLERTYHTAYMAMPQRWRRVLDS